MRTQYNFPQFQRFHIGILQNEEIAGDLYALSTFPIWMTSFMKSIANFFLVFCTNSTKYCRLWFQMNKFECRINVLLSLLSLSYPIRKAFDGWFRFAAQFHYSVESISRFSYGTTEYRYFSFPSAQPKKIKLTTSIRHVSTKIEENR